MTQMTFNLFPSIFAFISLQAIAQSTGHTPVITGMLSYRDELIAANPEGYKMIYNLEELWKEEHKEKSGQLMLNIVYAHEIYNMRPKKIMKKYKKRSPDSWIPALLTEEAIEAIIQNNDLIDLLYGGFLKPDPPFQINAKTNLFEELDFYQINNGMRIAEIGAGNGTFGLLLGLGFDSLQIFINDIDKFSLNYAEKKINNCASKISSNNYSFIKGEKKSTGMESKLVDKVIIRNSFHHFSHKKEMLASIKISLKPESDLYIYDPALPPLNEHTGCQKKMHAQEIKKVLVESGFEIINEKYLEGVKWVMLHCRLNKIK